jgi:hypothetical protein
MYLPNTTQPLAVDLPDDLLDIRFAYLEIDDLVPV